MPGIDSTSSRGKLQSAILRTTGKLPNNKIAVSRYNKLKEEFSAALFNNFDKYKRGLINAEQLKGYWQANIKDFYPRSYQLGLEIGEAPFSMGKFDRIFTSQAVSAEIPYINKFVDDIKSGAGIMPYDKRLEMYVNTLDSINASGFLESVADVTEIHWDLGEAEHCDDCLELAANSPYTKYNLPSLPRDGSTRCISNCLCRLRIEISEKPVRSPREPVDRQTVKLDRDLEKNVKQYFQREIPEGLSLPDDQQRMVLDGLFSDIYSIKGQLSVETDPIIKRELILQRQKLNADAIEFMKQNKIYYVRSWETVPTSGIKEVPTKAIPLTPPIPTGVASPIEDVAFPGIEKPKTVKPKEIPETGKPETKHISKHEKPIKNPSEAITTLQKDYSISKKEAEDIHKSIQKFTGSNYSYIRDAQTGLSNNKMYLKWSDDLEKYIDIAPKWSGGKIYRGLDFDTSPEIFEKFSNLSPGNIIDMKGTSSWSSSKKIVSEHILGSEYQVFITVENQKTGVSLAKYSRNIEEAEIVFSKKAKFKILDIKKSKSEYGKVLRITVEEI